MRQAACCAMVFIILAFSGPGQAEAWDREAFDEQLIDLCTQHEYREALDLTGQALKDLKRLGEQDEYDMAVCQGVIGSTGPDLKRGTADDTTMSYLPDQED